MSKISGYSLCKVFLIGIFLMYGCSSPESHNAGRATDSTTSSAEFSLGKGTNIAHWLSQSDARGAERRNFFTEEDVKYIADLGFDHIRIPIDEEQMWDKQGTKHAEAFDLLTNALDWSTAHGLRAIVDLHIVRSHHFNEAERPLWNDPRERDKFVSMWKQLSAELEEYPTDSVAYELMNEPVAEDPESWNRLARRTIDAIREVEPDRKIVLGSNRWQHTETFDDLWIPEDDPNIILSFHFYEPMLVTHYRASWTDLEDYNGPVHYPGKLVREKEMEDLSKDMKTLVRSHNRTVNRDSLEREMKEAIRVANKYGLPIYCGEFGVYSETPQGPRMRWYEDVQDLFEKHGIGYANWNYKSDGFGLVNAADEPQDPLINILLGK